MTEPEDTPSRPAANPDAAGLEAPVAEIDAALGKLRRSMMRRGLGRRALDELGLAVEPALVEVADVVAEADSEEADGVAVGTVAARLAVDPSQASRLVAEAVKAGLVQRLAAPSDGRRSVLSLTGDGTRLIAAARAQKRAILASHLSDWSADEVATFARLLKRFATIARG